jgi:hypothetical protein
MTLMPFCQTKQAEGARLDYKGTAFPKDLAKIIAAFSNTLGGLILLGVDADGATPEHCIEAGFLPPTVEMPCRRANAGRAW